MPELPEVETVCRSLRQTALNQTIESVTVRLPRLLRQEQPDTFGRNWRDGSFAPYGGGENIFCWMYPAAIRWWSICA